MNSLAGSNPSLLLWNWLGEARDSYLEHGLKDDAARVQSDVERMEPYAFANLPAVVCSLTMDDDQISDLCEALCQGSARDTLTALARTFVPDLAGEQKQAERLREQFPFSWMVEKIKVVDRRPTAFIGPVDEDAAGRLIDGLARRIQFSTPLLKRAIARCRDADALAEEHIVEFVTGTGLVDDEVISLVRYGVNAFAAVTTSSAFMSSFCKSNAQREGCSAGRGARAETERSRWHADEDVP